MQKWKPLFSTNAKITIKIKDADGKETKKFILQQEISHPKELMNIFWSVIELDMLYSFYKQNETKEIIQIVARMGQEHGHNLHFQWC